MSQPVIIYVETATNICSVALCKGEDLISIRESDEDRSHGSLLTVFMDDVLKESGLVPGDIEAISVSKGPGSYTGLRIGVSVTKGFAYAMNIPVIGIITLQALAVAASSNESFRQLQKKYPDILLCPLIDARRMEVYSAVYDSGFKEIKPVSATIIDEHSFGDLLATKQVAFFGNGSDKVHGIISHPNAHIIKDINPSALHMMPLTLPAFEKKEFENSAYFEPFYLKDFIATTPKNKLL
ncbi:MAG: tRNA (adenosine(37)-N6)-threonylcarbamoyltransferase complex dimerization subunit type 1 TsaB [Bacteroidales bacterium]